MLCALAYGQSRVSGCSACHVECSYSMLSACAGSYCKDFDWLPLSGSLNEVLVQLSAERKFASDSSENVFR